jgi:sulfonate transport system substrate-binding protein
VTRSMAILGVALALTLVGCGETGGGRQVRIPLGAGGVGFLPLFVMREHGLIEKHARAAGVDGLVVTWIDLGGPAVMNDALLSGSVDFITAGPPAFLTLWDRTRDSVGVRGVAALASLPMYLNTRSASLATLDDLTERDKVAVTAIKVSIPAIIMQMYAAEHHGLAEADRFDRYTVSMTHPDAVVALLSGASEIDAHFTSPPFHQREIQEPGIRTVMSSNDVMGGATTFTMMSTTARFREENPEIYSAVLAALREANDMIANDTAAAADVLIAADGAAGFTRDEIVKILNDPDIEFTTTPANTMKYAEFMHSIGSIEHEPQSWQDLFFPEIHSEPGS